MYAKFPYFVNIYFLKYILHLVYYEYIFLASYLFVKKKGYGIQTIIILCYTIYILFYILFIYNKFKQNKYLVFIFNPFIIQFCLCVSLL